MKALKEKRISLRSLLRRGLVILSIFALAFAVSCGGDDPVTPDDPGIVDPDPDPDPNPNPDPVEPKYVKAFSITKMPTTYSYQGFAPDLTGMEVTVTWSDGTLELIKDPAQFYTTPLVCEIPMIAYTSDAISTGGHGYYTVNHINSRAAAQPVAIPMVRAWNAEGPQFGGQSVVNKDLFEDRPVDTTGLTLEAVYDPILTANIGSAIVVGAGWGTGSYPQVHGKVAADTGVTEYKWTASAETPRKVIPFLSDSSLWKIDKATKTATYTVVPGKTLSFTYTNYYYVDKISYNEGSGTFDYFNPDEAEPDWLEVLTDAGATFKVSYYKTTQTFDITMADYKKAMNTVNPNAIATGGLSAAIPVTSPTVTATTAPTSILEALNQDIPLSIKLQYYDAGIGTDGSMGKGDTNPDANQGLVTIPVDRILRYTGNILATPVEGTDAINNQLPEVISPTGTLPQLLADLKTYYTVEWEYQSVDGTETRTLAYPGTGAANHTMAVGSKSVTINSWQNTANVVDQANWATWGSFAPDTGLSEQREITITVTEPPSSAIAVQPNPGVGEVLFQFWTMP